MEHPKANKKKRERFQNRLCQHKKRGRPIIYIDESGFALDSPRTHGYSLKGKRSHGVQDWHAKGRVNAIGAILDFKLLTLELWKCNIDSDVFYAWLNQSLLPKSPPNSVIVLDNATFHKRQDIQNAIKEAGHILEYLPAYSPDLNPIEHKWAQAKAIRRRLRCDPYRLFLSFV